MKYKTGDIVYLWPKSIIAHLEKRLLDDPEGLRKCKAQIDDYNKHLVISVDEKNKKIKCRTLFDNREFEIDSRFQTMPFTEEEYNTVEMQDGFC